MSQSSARLDPDDDCDLDMLTNMLEEDDDEEDLGTNKDQSLNVPNTKTDVEDDQCDIETLTSYLEDDSEEEAEATKNKNTEQSSPVNDLCQEEIEAFLNASDSDDEIQDKGQLVKDDKTVNKPEKTDEIVNKSEKNDKIVNKPEKSDKIVNKPEKNEKPEKDLQAELLLMQKKMKELEKQLQASQQSNHKETDVNMFFDKNESPNQTKKRPSSQAKIQSSNQAKLQPSNVTKNQSLKDKRAEMSKSLFGDDDDSNDTTFDGESLNSLSEEGKEIKKLIVQGERNRAAHIPTTVFSTTTTSNTWKSKSPRSEKQTVIPSRPATKQPADEKFMLEKNSGIRIIKPLVSSSVLELKMDGRKFLKVSKIHEKVKTTDIQGNWVTFGVVVSKTDPKTASSGKTFCIWKLSDLDDCDRTVSFFLFGQIYKEHWKNSVGSVVGLLNPNMMDAADKSPSEVAFTIAHPHQLLVLGQSKDLAWCLGQTKKGNKCTSFVNSKFGGFCAFHVQSAYKKASSKRSEFQGSMTGVTPKSFEKKIMPKGSHYMYGGQMFSSMEMKSNAKKKSDKLTVNKLLSQQGSGGKQKVTTLSIHDIQPEHQTKTHVLTEKEQSFVSMITTPSVGSLNLVKHLVKSEIQQKETKEDKPFVSITPKQLLQEHKSRMLAKKAERLASLGKSALPADPLSVKPTLGRGFYPGQDVCLDWNQNAKQRTPGNKVDRAKLLAISKIQSKGGCKKENPNAVKTVSLVQDKIKKRVLEDIESNKDDKPEEPPAKRSRLLGNVDLSSPEVKKLLKAKSSHMGAYKEAEAEREEKYFDSLEKREVMEDKMKSIKELACTLFTCKQCNYTAMSIGDKCKTERHDITKTKGKKRFFECKKCKQRTADFNKIPTRSCQHCGEYSFERVSMFKEKAGPKLDSEKLCIRGDEIKYLNSLNEKVYL